MGDNFIKILTLRILFEYAQRVCEHLFVTNAQIEVHSKSTTNKRVKLMILAAIGLMAGAFLVASPAAESGAHAAAVNPSVTWTAYSATVTTRGSANVQRFGCGLLHCSTTTSAYGRTGKTSGSGTPNAYQVKIQADQPVISGTVSVGSGGVAVGASVQGTTCVSPVYPSASGYSYVSISPGGEFCTARGATALSIEYKVSGDYRVGSSWSSNSSSQVGG